MADHRPTGRKGAGPAATDDPKYPGDRCGPRPGSSLALRSPGRRASPLPDVRIPILPRFPPPARRPSAALSPTASRRTSPSRCRPPSIGPRCACPPTLPPRQARPPRETEPRPSPAGQPPTRSPPPTSPCLSLSRKDYIFAELGELLLTDAGHIQQILHLPKRPLGLPEVHNSLGQYRPHPWNLLQLLRTCLVEAHPI